MFPDLNFYPLNWVDGIKISSKDFIDWDNAILDWMRDVRRLSITEHKFGLLPGNHADLENYPKFELENKDNSILISLKECRAVTSGGVRIEISEHQHIKDQIPETLPNYKLPSTATDGRYDIFISVDLFDREGAGKPAEVGPPRRIYAYPKMLLSLVKATNNTAVSGPNQLKIGELNIDAGRASLDTEFIAPSFSVESHLKLKNYSRDFGMYLEKILQNGISTFNTSKKVKSESHYAADVNFFAEKVIFHLAPLIDQFKNTFIQESPVEYVNKIYGLARLTKTSMECLIYQDDFFKNYPTRCRNEIREGNIAELAQVLLDTESSNNNLTLMFEQAELFLKSMNCWFEELSNETFRADRSGVIRVR